jgi:hypothetical protein
MSIILERSVNYFDHFGSGVLFLKIGCAKCNFTINLRVSMQFTQKRMSLAKLGVK